MANGERSAGGRLSLGERVHNLEHRTAEHHRALKRIKAGGLSTDNEELLEWVGKKVEIIPADPQRQTEQGILQKVHRYTLLLNIGGAPEVVNKGQVFKIRLVE